MNKKLYEKIEEHLTVFKAEELIDKQVCNLSGGELQRVLLSMAVMDEPNLLLLDEPVSGIDQNGMDLFYHTISELKRHYDLAIILISHDLDYVAQYADQVILIDGTVKKQGTVRQVYESEEFQEVFGKFDLENYKPSRQVKEQKEKEIAMPKHSDQSPDHSGSVRPQLGRRKGNKSSDLHHSRNEDLHLYPLQENTHRNDRSNRPQSSERRSSSSYL